VGHMCGSTQGGRDRGLPLRVIRDVCAHMHKRLCACVLMQEVIWVLLSLP